MLVKDCTTDIQLLLDRMSARSPVLVLGAGFSCGVKNKDGKALPTAGGLAEELYKELLEKNSRISAQDKDIYREHRNDLRQICDDLRLEELVEERDRYLTRRFYGCQCRPDDYHMLLRHYPWRHIYSLNIDDLVEYIYSFTQKREQPLVHIKQHSSLDSNTALELFKPHGSVRQKNLGYVFDTNEYHDLIAAPNWAMQHFTELFLSNDVIFLGTEFQEEDLQIMITKSLKLVEINHPYHYFFISPEIKNRGLNRMVEKKSNLHIINWTTEKFLNTVKNRVIDLDDKRRKMRDYGMVFFDEKYEEAQKEMPRYLSELYLGAQPRPIDFFKDLDIVRPNMKDIAKDIARKGGHQLLTIAGISYVGKTCSAIRVGIDLTKEGYAFSMFNRGNLDASTYRKYVVEFLGLQPNGKKIAIMAEDIAYYYKQVRLILEECPDNIESLVFICTSNKQDHDAKRYLLDTCSGLTELVITEKTDNPAMAAAIYDKLEAQHHLNRLLTYGENRKSRIQYIRQLNDLIEVLYVSQEGRGFISHFSQWVESRPNNANREGFLILCNFSRLGVPNLTKPLFQDILHGCGIFLDVAAFLKDYEDLVQVDNGTLHLRCSRLLRPSVQKLTDETQIFSAIKATARVLASNLQERDENIRSEIFQKLIKVKALHREFRISMNDILNLLLEIEPICKHLSYYWVQRGICHREMEHFEEANNALAEAANIRSNTSFHVMHAQAKNYMAWGVWALENEPSHAAYFFDQGKSILEKLIQDAPGSYYAYSVHTYVDMMIRYHQDANIQLSEVSLQNIGVLLQRLLLDFDEPMSRQIVCRFLDYCKNVDCKPAAVMELHDQYNSCGTIPRYEGVVDTDDFEE